MTKWSLLWPKSLSPNFYIYTLVPFASDCSKFWIQSLDPILISAYLDVVHIMIAPATLRGSSGTLLILQEVWSVFSVGETVGLFHRAPRWHSGQESAWQCRKHKRCTFDPWVRKIPWSRKWQPVPVFLPGKFHGQRSLVGFGPGGSQRDRHDWVHACVHTHSYSNLETGLILPTISKWNLSISLYYVVSQYPLEYL